ncbi:MAG: hypothetical protein Q9209_007868, partial [Squamulea sp. 1 TL-2023]
AQWYHVFTAPGEPPGMFTIADNQRHLERRRQVNEFYTTKAINTLAYRVDHVSRMLLVKLAQKADLDGDSPLDICQMIKFYAYDALANLTFGQVFGCLEKNSDVNGLIEGTASFLRYCMTVGVFVEWHDLIVRILQALIPAGNVGLLHLMSIGEKAIKKMDTSQSAADKSTAFGMAQKEPHSFVSLLQEKHLKDPSNFSPQDVTYHMIPNIVAGADTSSAGLNAAIYYLWRNPQVLAKLRDELEKWAAVNGKREADRVISMTEAQQMRYLQAVLKETLRMFPGLGNNQVRVVPEGGLTISDQFFPAGTVVGMNAYVAHANRDVFGADADDFRPERWLGDDDSRTQMEQYFLS